MTQFPQQQWPPAQGGYGMAPAPNPMPAPMPGPPPAPPRSTRSLTVTKWVSVGLAILLLPLMVLWLMQGLDNLDDLRKLSALAAGDGSGDGKGLKGGDEAIAWWEFLVVLQSVTLGVVVLIGILALIAGAGKAWARVLCTIMIFFPIGVIIFGVIDSGSEGLYGLVFLVPFIVMLVLWWLPGTSRGLRAKAAARAPHPPMAPQPQYWR